MNTLYHHAKNSMNPWEIDQRFKNYTTCVYGNMSGGLLLTAFTSHMLSRFAHTVDYAFKTPFFYMMVFVPLALAVYYNFKWHRLKSGTARILFILYAGMIGLSIALLFIGYIGESIARIFLTASSMFGATGLYGYISKQDLTSGKSFMVMGGVGVMIVMAFNFFMRLSNLQASLSFLAIIIFIALTSMERQRLRTVYQQASEKETLGKTAIKGALMMYLDFINIFNHLAQVFGKRKAQ
jgi:FtsH-binding integral membrane protein